MKTLRYDFWRHVHLYWFHYHFATCRTVMMKSRSHKMEMNQSKNWKISPSKQPPPISGQSSPHPHKIQGMFSSLHVSVYCTSSYCFRIVVDILIDITVMHEWFFTGNDVMVDIKPEIRYEEATISQDVKPTIVRKKSKWAQVLWPLYKYTAFNVWNWKSKSYV